MCPRLSRRRSWLAGGKSQGGFTPRAAFAALAASLCAGHARQLGGESPLANLMEAKAGDGSPKHVSADYYYRIPVRPIYKQYPIYAPGHEPPGYFEWLKKQKPVIVWDDKGHAPPLETEAD
jgi:hypothetical protein